MLPILSHLKIVYIVFKSFLDLPEKIDILEGKSYCLFKWDINGQCPNEYALEEDGKTLYCEGCNNTFPSLLEFLNDDDSLSKVEYDSECKSFSYECLNKYPAPNFEHAPQFNGFYHKYFSNSDFVHFSCMHPRHGPILISLSRKIKRSQSVSTLSSVPRKIPKDIKINLSPSNVRVAVRTTCPYGLYMGIPYNEHTMNENFDFEKFLKRIVKNYFPTLNSIDFNRVEDSYFYTINKMDDSNKQYLHKIGVILCLEDQETEEKMYANSKNILVSTRKIFARNPFTIFSN
ncbi:hypothetical protein HZS_156 [Henneguya salminicola]|nr:hypothetical protein HZS_156 [Henneguya salminicola]